MVVSIKKVDPAQFINEELFYSTPLLEDTSRILLHTGIEPENFTYLPLLKVSSRLSALREKMQIHGYVFKLGLQSDVFVQNSLINV